SVWTEVVAGAGAPPPTVAHPERIEAKVKTIVTRSAIRTAKVGWLPTIRPRLLSIRRLSPLAEEKQRATHLEPIAALERVAARHGMPIHEYLAAGRTDDEILALAPDDRVIAEHCLIAEQSDVAFFGAADNRHALEQGIFAALARVAALAAHDHQPATLEQLADQSDEKSDQRAEDDDRDRSTERLRKRARQALVKKSAERSAEHAADSAIAPPAAPIAPPTTNLRAAWRNWPTLSVSIEARNALISAPINAPNRISRP